MDNILEIENLRICFPINGKEVPAVDGISFDLRRGGVVGIVGESGCGKSLTALSLLRLIDSPGRISSGRADFFENPSQVSKKIEGVVLPGQAERADLLTMTDAEIRQVRGNKIAMIFQEPMTSLNPVFTIGDQIIEAILIHKKISKGEAKDLATEMLRKVHIPDPEKRLNDYPHQMSGGMRQRAMIAMALSCEPAILIADEPTTALDVTTQAQILELIQELISDSGMSVILITHDLGVVAQMCQEVMVMYAGMIIEKAPVKRLFSMPKHPYTIGLLKSIPELFEDEQETLFNIPGTVPSLNKMPKGCRFADRCSRVLNACRQETPSFKYLGEEQSVRCLNY